MIIALSALNNSEPGHSLMVFILLEMALYSAQEIFLGLGLLEGFAIEE